MPWIRDRGDTAAWVPSIVVSFATVVSYATSVKPAMSAIESEAVFRNRSMAMGLVQADLDTMRIKGWVTFSRCAFASSFIPGQGDDATFIVNVVEVVLGDRNHPRASVLR